MRDIFGLVNVVGQFQGRIVGGGNIEERFKRDEMKTESEGERDQDVSMAVLGQGLLWCSAFENGSTTGTYAHLGHSGQHSSRVRVVIVGRRRCSGSGGGHS